MSNRPKRNLQSVPRLLNKVASGLFRWVTTDHSRIGQIRKLMPKRRFLDELLDILVCLLIALFGAVLQVVWIVFLIAYAIPFLIFGHF
ncbi:hypothetical protein [Nitrosomonas ureae]|uniref:Uncharacterized protein n=1 Tax=Nitrosomonas ureae TaxID=44577 RepID=A0A1H9G632_9PROT|nr:hypothetical protein [Nitrosomonas ureae]SEQ45625.1 hypothetical protein SAMN05421510_10568 [Nitrosomonas ureae]